MTAVVHDLTNSNEADHVVIKIASTPEKPLVELSEFPSGFDGRGEESHSHGQPSMTPKFSYRFVALGWHAKTARVNDAGQTLAVELANHDRRAAFLLRRAPRSKRRQAQRECTHSTDDASGVAARRSLNLTSGWIDTHDVKTRGPEPCSIENCLLVERLHVDRIAAASLIEFLARRTTTFFELARVPPTNDADPSTSRSDQGSLSDAFQRRFKSRLVSPVKFLIPVRSRPDRVHMSVDQAWYDPTTIEINDLGRGTNKFKHFLGRPNSQN